MSDQLPGSMNEHEPSMEDILASIRELIAEDSPEAKTDAMGLAQVSEAVSAADGANLAQDVVAKADQLEQNFDLEMTDGLGDDLVDPDFEQSQIFGRVIEDAPSTPDITADLDGLDIDDSSTKDFLASAGFEIDEDLSVSASDDSLLLTGTLGDPEIALSNNGEPVVDLPEIVQPDTDISAFDETIDLAAALDDDLVSADVDLLNDGDAQDDILSDIFADLDAVSGEDVSDADIETPLQTENLLSNDDFEIDNVLVNDDSHQENEIDFDAIFADEPVSRPGVDNFEGDVLGSDNGASTSIASPEPIDASLSVDALNEILPSVEAAPAVGAASIAAGLATGVGLAATKLGNAEGHADVPELDISELDAFDIDDLLLDEESRASSGDDVSLGLSDALAPSAEFGDGLEALLPDIPEDVVAPELNASSDEGLDDDLAAKGLESILEPDEIGTDSLVADLLGTDEVEPLTIAEDEAVISSGAVGAEFDGLKASHDDDIDLVKSLMAELTDDSYETEGEEPGGVVTETVSVEELDATSPADLGLALDEDVPDLSSLLYEGSLAEETSNDDDSSLGGLAALVAAGATAAAGASIVAATTANEEDRVSSEGDIDLDKTDRTDLDLTELGDILAEEPVSEAVVTAEQKMDNLEDEAMPHIVKTETVASDDTVEAASGAFASLNKVVEEKAVYNESGPRIGDLVQDALRPMLQEWLDKNLKGIVDRAVAKEIKRISSGK